MTVYELGRMIIYKRCGDLLRVDESVLEDFGLKDVQPLKVSFSLGRYVLNKMPYKAKRKLRYWASEKRWILRPFFAIIYNDFRN